MVENSNADTAHYEVNDGVAVITLNRPQAKNAINPALHERLKELWNQVDADDAVEVAILTGTGDAFCAGSLL
jgi:enoyl-CoA hydratase/carnithine racemase